MSVVLEVGLVVRMKSGGPSMTIEAIGVAPPWYLSKKRTVQCVWFDHEHKIKRALFDPQTLVVGITKKA